LLNKRRCNHGR